MDWQGDLPHDHAFVDFGFSGLPGDLDIQQMLRDTEEKLKLNACCIEQCLKELQVKLGDSWTGDKAPTPTDCLQWFSPRKLSLLKPNCTGHQELLDFLRALQQYLRSEAEGREEMTLQLLLSISSQCGVVFPNPAPLTAQQLATGSPLHAVREEAALEVQEAWEDVRRLLRRHLLDELQKAACWTGGADKEGGGGDGGEPDFRVHQRVRWLQHLLFLYPEAEVLSRYQGLRAKAVQDLLLSAQSSSPAEPGFDRLADSFQTAGPALRGMVREDLRVLNSVTEMPSILAFVNQAHLSTVSQELCGIMERLCESASKDNTSHLSKAGKTSTKSKAAIAPQEPPRRGRNFCLTSHQLRCLSQLSGTLLDLEEGVEELVAELGFLNCAGEAPCSVRGILKKAKDDPETATRDSSKASPDLLLQAPEAMTLEFDWRVAFRELAQPMAHCLKVLLEDVCAKSLQQVEGERTSGSALIALDAAARGEGSSATCPETESPKMIAKFCGDIIEELDALFPLVLACREDPLLDVRASFVEVCGKVTSAVLGRLEERATEVPRSAPLKNLPTLLATAACVHQRLTQYEAHLKDSARMPLSLLPIQRYQELMGTLCDHLTGYCTRVCATCILHDAESHHWGDPKPFYEGERCSFSIQMWHYFLSGLRSDLWAVLPPGLAQEILAQVLSETLEMLVQRYSLACPTYKRSQQMRADITAILLCVEQLMWSVCDSTEALIRPDPRTRPWVYSIHSFCNQLLGVLVVVTAPLPTLCRTFHKGAGDQSSSSTAETSPSIQVSQWLRLINPALFPQESVRILTADELAAQGQLQLMASQPSCNYQLLLQTLLHSECLLPRVLLSDSHDEGSDSSENCHNGDAFMEAMFSTLSTLNNLPKALALVLEGYLDSRRLWDHLYNLADPGRAEPMVMRCVRAAVTKPIGAIVGHLVAMVQATEDRATSLPGQDVPESVLSKVPKEWNYTPRDSKASSGKSCIKLMMRAVSFVFTNLPSVVASLPLPVRYLFHVGENHLSHNARQLRPTGLLLWGFLSCLCQSLEDGNALERLAGRPLDRGSRDKLALLGECLQVTMGLQKGVPKPTVHKVLQNLEERRPKWCSIQLQKARKLCSEGAFQPAESGVAPERGSSAPELTEQKISLMVLEICHKPGGSEYLRQIYHIIQLNEELLRSRLSAPSDSGAETSCGAVKVSLGPVDPRSPGPAFNPFAQFNRIGSKDFDQSTISEWDWDWPQLLPTYQGMSQVTLRALLANRWEMQHAAALEDEEKALVDLLQKAYFNKSPGS